MDKKGFTLIEMVMVITLLGIIGGIIAPPLYQATRGWFAVTTREGITESGRIAMERMMREVRNTRRTSANNPCISSAAATSFVFSNYSSDCSNPVTFDISGSNIQLNGINLADNVQTLAFTYYDATNAPTAVVGNVRRVAIEIVSTRGGETARKYSEVYLSNMKGY